MFFQHDAQRRQYAEAGISELILIKPLEILIKVVNFKIPTSPGLRILHVMHCVFIFIFLLITFANIYLFLRLIVKILFFKIPKLMYNSKSKPFQIGI